MRLDEARLAGSTLPPPHLRGPDQESSTPTAPAVSPSRLRPRRRGGQRAGGGDPVAVQAVAAALRAAEPRLTQLDQAVGDGDLGSALARGADAAEAAMTGARGGADAVLARIGDAVRREVGGTSGPLYAALLVRAARTLGDVPEASAPDAAAWAAALQQGTEAVATLGGARRGDRTMLDALLPGAEAFAAGLGRGLAPAAAWAQAVEAAEAGAEATATMLPRLGRSSYLGARALGTPDPGAVGVGIWMRALLR